MANKDKGNRQPRELSDTEKVAIEWAILTETEFDSDDKWSTAYTISHKVKDDVGINAVLKLATAWKNSAKVKRYIQAVGEERKKRDEVIRKSIERQILQNDDTMREFLDRVKGESSDYQQIAENKGNRSQADIVRELNLLVDSIEDSKDRAQILMKLGDYAGLTKDKAADDIHRYYTPISMNACQECALYKLGESVLIEEALKAKER